MDGEITRLLAAWSGGDGTALDRLMPLVYDELRMLVRAHLRRYGENQTLQSTAVVNEAYLRLVNHTQVNLQGRAQFFGLAAKIIHDLLVDDLRRRRQARFPSRGRVGQSCAGARPACAR